MTERPKTAQEKRWQAEEDAYTLARAEELKKDPKRLTAARNKAAEQAAERQEQADALKKVARRSANAQLQDREAPAEGLPNRRTTANTGSVSSGAQPSGPKPVTFFDNPPARTPKK